MNYQNHTDSMDYQDTKDVLSPTPSPECSGSDDEEASRESYGVSSIRLFDNEMSMTGGSSNSYPHPLNFASLHSGDQVQLSSSLPSTSIIFDGNNTEPIQSTANITGRKRTFSITAESKPADRRTATKVCRVCSDKAYSYNFNVITCESCKAFFRRNANKEKEIRCPFNGQCDINIVSRRFCQKCRLEKCFNVGMKKEWIMSEEARMEKKKRIMDNRERRAAERHAEDKQNKGNAEELAAAIVGQPLHQMPQVTVPSAAASAVAQVAAALLPAVQNNVQFGGNVSGVSPLLTAAASVAPQPTAEVAQLAAAVAQVAAAHNNQNQMPNTTFQPMQTHNDAGQIATERALMCSIVASANASAAAASNNQANQPPQTAAQFVSQQQMVNPLAVAQAAQVAQAQLQHAHMEQQLQQQAAVQAQQIAAVQAVQAAAIVQQHQQNQLVAAAVAAAASTIVPSVQQTQPTTVVVPAVPQMTSAPTGNQCQQQNDMVTIPRDMLLKLVEQRIESEQSQQQLQNGAPAPIKCQCRCQCGRYPNELLIVDKVMTDLLDNSTKYNNSKHMSQLSPKSEQPTPPLNMLSTSPPQSGLSAQVNNYQTMAMNMSNQHQGHQMLFQPMCTGTLGPITTSTMPIQMEDDYVYKSMRTAAC